MSPQATPSILTVDNLVVGFETGNSKSNSGLIRAVDRVGFSLKAGQVLGIAGESGCGKSVTALSIMRLLPRPAARIMAGQILFHGQDLVKLPVDEMHAVRGNKISMIFQEPMTALNPVHTVGRQLMEVYTLHFPDMTRVEKRQSAVNILDQVGIPDSDRFMDKYPHQLSGGMRQRVMIAMALACEPEILIADEPTTALDVTVQAQIMALILDLKDRMGMSVILITHDLGVIAENCDEGVIMYAGRIVEQAPVYDLFKTPKHPYTRGLLASIPSRSHGVKTRLPNITGNVPALSDMPDSCRFATRCPLAEPRCVEHAPEFIRIGKNRSVACHLLS